MPRNYPSQYQPRTYAAYTAAMDEPLVIPPALAPVYVVGVIPTGLTIARVTRVGWSLSGSTGGNQIRLLQVDSMSGGVFTPATRRTKVRPSGSIAHRGGVLGDPIVPIITAGTPIFATWLAAGIAQNSEGAEQEAVLENPIELAAGRGLVLEVTTLIAGDSAIEAYFDWEEFQ